MKDIDTSHNAATYIGVHDATLRAWRMRGCGPAFFRAGAAIRYRRAAVEAWIDAQTRTSTVDPGPPPVMRAVRGKTR